MKSIFQFIRMTLLCALLTASGAVLAETDTFSFGVIGHTLSAHTDEAVLRQAITESDIDNLAFVVANGIKASTEPCSDTLYAQRKELFDSAKNGLIISLAASDWTYCKTENGKPVAIERLSRIRELFFSDEFSFGASKIPLIRQATSPKFHSYVENARWEINNVLFATINLPANNNHYLSAGGRNSEFEDRLIANQEWLQRIFMNAAQKKSKAIVLFCDGDPLVAQHHRIFDFNVKRDGFTEIRKKIVTLTSTFHGKVLLIHSAASTHRNIPPTIVWQRNLGDLEVTSGWFKLTVDSTSTTIFELDTTYIHISRR